MTKTHLVTGATGFVGGALVIELLQRTDAEVACLVREDGSLGAQQRLHASLLHAASSYDCAHLASEIHRRCIAVPGDILAPSCGAAAMRLGNGGEIWHCAASLKFREEQGSEIFAHNVEGTRNILKLARSLKCSALNYVSTAYVAGARNGVIREERPLLGAATNNSYEESKVQAEILLTQFAAVPTRILRPSIVIGHSRTHASTSSTGLYGCIKELHRLKTRMSRQARRPSLYNGAIRIVGQPETPLNLIPVDAVAADSVRVSLSNTSAQIFHLTNGCPPQVACLADVVMDALGLPRPSFVESASGFSLLEQAVARALVFYGSYLNSPKIFDRTNTDACGGKSQWPLDAETLTSYVQWFLATAVAAAPRRLAAV
jgi:nucleoside-diphosphate-sugar epimerase